MEKSQDNVTTEIYAGEDADKYRDLEQALSLSPGSKQISTARSNLSQHLQFDMKRASH